MTKFMSYYNLFMLSEPKELIGIDADRDDGHIIVTLGKSMVMIIKISTQKSVRSWLISEKLSAKVVYDRQSEKYVGVFGNRVIRCWDANITDVTKCKRLKFKKSIADLLTVDNDTFVLYSDGSCETLSKAINSRKNDIESGPLQIELSVTYTFSGASIWNLEDSKILTYFKHNNVNGNLELIRLDLENNNIVTYSINRTDENVKIAGYIVFDEDDGPTLLTIWSDRRIFLLNLQGTEPEKSPGDFVALLTELQLEKPISLVNVSRNFIAIYGANSSKDGGFLLLYNTKFKVVKGKQFFKIYFDVSRLWKIKEHLLLAMGQNLSVISYQMSKDVLADLIGSQISNDYTKLAEYDFNEEESFHEGLTLEEQFIQNGTGVNFAKNMNHFDMPKADGQSTAYESVSNFNNTINELSRLHLHIDVLEIDRNLNERKISLMKNYNDDGFVNWHVQTIANRLERSGASEYEVTEKLLTYLIKADLLQDIAVCLRRYNNLSEKILARTLSYLLEKFTPAENQSQNEKKTNDSTEQMEVDLPEALDNGTTIADIPNFNICEQKFQRINRKVKVVDVLNTLLLCTFDTEAIVVHLRHEIDYPKLLKVFVHLYNLFTSKETVFEKHSSYLPQSIYVEIQIIRWLSVFLSSHYQNLVLSKDENMLNILVNWSTLASNYIRQAEDLNELHCLINDLLDCKSSYTENNLNTWYSIEEVNLF
ncbi:uncharacterized protein LOC119680910 [Teleopsis dalmanni]|uniref:uncharacterized protein LOC119680910 n=1 Tax=Teleopsis dalmanni TaxID=139649 RepID=UPI0018CC8269|nr:uncharacterized protein LOC119680910 [Teleopsis dalmanni]